MTIAPTMSDDVIRYPSLESMRAAHTELLKAFRGEGATPEMVARVEAFIQRGRATGALLDTESERWSAQSQLDYWSTQLYRPGYPTPNSTLDEFDPELAPELGDELCPYVGLDTFRELNQAIFFGREHLVSELIEKLKSVRFLAVLGSSGSGKSSVVRAGLIPKLKNGALPGSAEWTYFKPMVPGSNPLMNLAHLMEGDEEGPTHQADEVEKYRKDPANLAHVASTKFSGDLVLVVDQFEEIFTLCTDEGLRQCFVENLIRLSQVPEAEHRVILTMRSDFETNIARLPELQKLFEGSAVRVTPLNASELREAIEAPAARIGLKFEEGVVDALLNDTLGEPAALPLLQFTLLKLWENRERNRITWEAYKRLGGGREALARSADDFYNHLIPEERDTMRRILLKMVRPGEGLEVTSNRVPRRVLYQKAEANDRIDRVLDRLIAARLVRISEGDIAGDEQVEVAHEALVRNWPRLVEWLEEERTALRQRQRLTTAAEEWQRLERDPLALWRGLLLEEARHYDDLNSLETEFLEAGYEAERVEEERVQNEARQQRELEFTRQLAENEKARAEEQARSASKLRQGRVYLVVALALALVLGIYAARLAAQSKVAAQTAEANAQVAQKNAAIALKNEEQAKEAQLEAEKARQSAVEAVMIAEAQRSVARAQIYQSRTGQLYTSTLLALDSWKRSPTDEAQEILRENISLLPIPVAQSFQHGEITALELNPKGRTFLAASADGNVCVCSLEDAAPLFLVTSPGAVYHAIFILGGNYIVIGTETGVVQVLNAENGNIENTFEYKAAVRGVDFSEARKELAIALEDGMVEVINLENPAVRGASYRLQIGGKISVADMSPDGKWYSVGSAAGSVTVWNFSSGQIISRTEDRLAILSLRFSPNSRFLIAAGADSQAVVFGLPTGEVYYRFFQGSDWLEDVAFFPDSTSFATASNDGRVQVWDMIFDRERRVMFADAAVTTVKISPDGKWIAAKGEDGTVRVWSAYTGVEMFEIPFGNEGAVLAFSNDSQRLLAGDVNGNIAIWDISGITSPSSYVQSPELLRIARFDSSGGRLIVADAYRVWFLNPDGLLTTDLTSAGKAALEFKAAIDNLVVSPDGQFIGVSTLAKEYIIYNLVSRQPITVVPAGEASILAFSGDSSRFITGTKDGVMESWNVKTGKRISSFNVGLAILAISAGPQGVAVGAKDKIILLDANAEQKITEWEAPGENRLLALNADNSMLASTNSSGQFEIWKQENSAYVLQNILTREQPYSMDFNLASNVLAVGTANKVYLIDASTGEEVGRIHHKGNVLSVSFSPDGKTLATASLKTLQLWEVSKLGNTKTDDLAETACSRLFSNLSLSAWNVLFGSDQPYAPLCEGLPTPE